MSRRSTRPSTRSNRGPSRRPATSRPTRGADFSTFAGVRRGEPPPYSVDPLPPHGTERFVRPFKDYRWASRADHASVLQAAGIWRAHFAGVDYGRPRFMWVNFTLTDSAMHRGGPHSEMAETALEETDARIGDVLAAIEQAGRVRRLRLRGGGRPRDGGDQSRGHRRLDRPAPRRRHPSPRRGLRLPVSDPEVTLVSLGDIEAAREIVRPVARHTPLEPTRTISSLAGVEVLLKCENLQSTGSFKIRGAYHRLSRLSAAEKAAGVVAASAGNHAQGVALAARLLGTSALVFMPRTAALPKIQATRDYGAEVVLEGESYEDAQAAAEKAAADEGRLFVPPFDDPFVIAGQGTLGLEILDDRPDVAAVVVPIGGGGLISGIGAAIKRSRPKCRVIGVEAAGAASAIASRHAGHPVALPKVATFCDGIAVKHPGELTFAHIEEFVDDIVTVDDEATARAALLLLERAKLVVEPSGAVGVAALLEHVVDAPSPRGRRPLGRQRRPAPPASPCPPRALGRRSVPQLPDVPRRPARPTPTTCSGSWPRRT